MNKINTCIFSCAGILALAMPGHARPGWTNIVYSQEYTYEFNKDENIVGCITRATAVLAKAGIGEGITSDIDNDKSYGVVYGWNADRTEMAEFSCSKKEERATLLYANYSDDPDGVYARWKKITSMRW